MTTAAGGKTIPTWSQPTASFHKKEILKFREGNKMKNYLKAYRIILIIVLILILPCTIVLADFNSLEEFARHTLNIRYSIEEDLNYPVTIKPVNIEPGKGLLTSCNFSIAIAGITLPPSIEMFASCDGNYYHMPDDFNKMLFDNNLEIKPENALGFAKVFILAALKGYSDDTEITNITMEEKEINGISYHINARSWIKINGISILWHFQIRSGQFSLVRSQVVEILEGDYIAGEEEYLPSLGSVKYYHLDTFTGGVKAQTPTVTVSASSLIIAENQTPVPEGQRTITVTIADFPADTDVEISITSEHNGVTETITTTPVNPITIHTDGSGNGSQVFIIDGNSATGFSIVRASGGVNTATAPLLIEKIRTDSFRPGYDLTLYYVSQFFDFDETDCEDFVQDVLDGMLESYNIQVTDWDFQEPPDADNDYEVSINDGNMSYHGFGFPTYTGAMSSSQRSVGIQNNISTFIANYSTEEILIDIALFHEFYHGIQWGYNSWKMQGNPNWSDWLYFLEGQARFIQSAQFPSEEFQNGRLYPNDANDYLQSRMNTSLTNIAYDYCLYWRYLYENYNAGDIDSDGDVDTKDNITIIVDCYAETDNVGNDAITDGETAMNTALAAGGGDFSTFDESIIEFGNAIALIDDKYNEWDNDEVYEDPDIEHTEEFDGSQLTIADEIPEPFGIDLNRINFADPDERMATIEFKGDPDANGTLAEFHVSLILCDNGTHYQIIEIPLDASGEGDFELWGTLEDGGAHNVESAIIVVTRLDADESLLEYDYEIKITPIGMDVALIIDRSGSMNTTDKLPRAKAAARYFVDDLKVGDQVTIASFSSSGSVNAPLTYIPDEDPNHPVKVTLKNAINSISAGGMTNFGAGLDRAYSQLVTSDVPEKYALFMSNGQHNTGSYTTQVANFKAKGWPIYTVAFGSNANESSLQWMASQTGGSFFSATSTDIQSIYDLIQSLITGRSTIMAMHGWINMMQTVMEHIGIPPWMDEIKISVFWPGSDLNLILIAPDGTEINPQVADINPDISYTKASTYAFYKINDPMEGEWEIQVTGMDVPSGGTEFSLNVSGVADISGNFLAFDSYYDPAEPVLVRVSLREKEGVLWIPVFGALVKCLITRPDVTVDSVELYDNGAGGDAFANDGIYSCIYSNTNTYGSYQLKAYASGIASGGPFTSELQKTIRVGPHMQISIWSNSLTPPPNSYIQDQQPTIEAVIMGPSANIDTSSIIMSLDGNVVQHSYDPINQRITYIPSQLLMGGPHMVTIDVSDAFGNPVSQAAWIFNVVGFGNLFIEVVDNGSGLCGVPVDIYNTLDSLVFAGYTDPIGEYYRDSMFTGVYKVCIVPPLGYYTDQTEAIVEIQPEGEDKVRFELDRLNIIPSQQSSAFWKHIVAGEVYGIGDAHEDYNLPGLADLIYQHFQQNPAHPIKIFGNSYPSSDLRKLFLLLKLLGGQPPLEQETFGFDKITSDDGLWPVLSDDSPYLSVREKAIREMTALLLNVASNKLATFNLVGVDKITVSQVIVYTYDLLTNGDADDDAVALAILSDVNYGREVAAGMVPMDTENIAFRPGSEISIPDDFSLSQNYPNPFNSETVIYYSLPEECHVEIQIINIVGQHVNTLVETTQSAGHYNISWNGIDKSGEAVASGIYFYKIDAGRFTDSRKMILLK
jgi:hypothetical protein